MIKLGFLAIIVFPLTLLADYWQQDVKYDINVTIDDSQRLIEGSLKLEYTNNSPDTLTFLYFRLSPNSIQKGSYSHRKEKAQGGNRFDNANSDEFGYCNLSSFTDDHGEQLDFTLDYSIARVELSQPLFPNQTRTFYIDFVTKLPSQRLAYRFAYIEGQYKSAHWYPQICVYDRELGWVNNQYLGWGEIYGDIGDYEVSITAPSDFIIAATGVLINAEQVFPDSLKRILERKNFEGSNFPDLSFLKGETKTWRFHAEKVCDFVFCADRRFCFEEAEYNGIKILTYPRWEHARAWSDAAETGRRGMQFFCENFGGFAYPQISITDSWGGMEYPMLIMCSGQSPDYYLLFWHEMAHNYFMGAVASNQTDRAFLDEGFTTFLEIAAMEYYLGREDNLVIRDNWIKKRFYPHEEDRIYRGFRPYLDPAIRGYTLPMPVNADSAPEWLIYRASSYYKPVSMLFALEYILGREKLFSCIKNYYEEWKYRHPYEGDMFASFEKTSGKELTYFFQEWVYTDKKLDYAVKRPEMISNSGGIYHYRIQIERNGETIIPLRLLVKLEDGEDIDYWVPLNDDPPPSDKFIVLPLWDQLRIPGGEYSQEITVPGKIKELDLDKESLLADTAPWNNRWPYPKVQCNWWLTEEYPPVGAYGILHRPDANYNGIDGIEIGWRFKSSFLDYKHSLRAGFDVGLKNGCIDYSLAYSTPISRIDDNLFLTASAFSRDGYEGVDLGIKVEDKPRYQELPLGILKVAFQHRSLFAVDYLHFPQIWDRGLDNLISVDIRRKFFRDHKSKLEVSFKTDAFSDFEYSSIEGRFMQYIRIAKGFDLQMDFGSFYIAGEKIPTQRLFFPSGWRPELGRSQGYWEEIELSPVIEDFNYLTKTAPGLYGLFDQRVGQKQLSSFSTELHLPPNIYWRPIFPIIGDIFNMVLNFRPLIFTDGTLDIWDAGLGFSMKGGPYGEFKMVFPLWIEPAPTGDDNFDLRWVIVLIPNKELW